MSKKRRKKRLSDEFPPPDKPLSFQQMVDKILGNEEFAEYIHGEILKERDPRQSAASRQSAADTLGEWFLPLAEELEALKLPPWLLDEKDVNSKFCTRTHMLLDFATPAQIWPE